ncbi:class I SAM-dependent methyltransferase [Actinokineospora terrae]|uniref:Methyltransferase domain-containing protein n=1 Tax=Actinokineospora terrae TaxID=155974 RepID=A0A1H9WNA2_9PSEU|nr:class I SAM-dependent methyltransferase [Actinokineospora terrae]SES35416.1 Methyltransferase domain-containing protein [Actinokineospora terrae]
MAHAHTHDGIDWAARVGHLRRADEIEADALAAVARRLLALLPGRPTVVDVGSGTGGMAAALATEMGDEGGRVVLVDAEPALQEIAVDRVRAAAGDRVDVVTVLADAMDPDLPGLVPPGDLLWASGVVHHLPDQLACLTALVRVLRAGGLFALREGGLTARCLPWDLGLGEPGLQDRLHAARDAWFARMRTTMDGSVRLPLGWNLAMVKAGLVDVTSFSYLVDLPAPAPLPVRRAVADWLGGLAAVAGEGLGSADQTTLRRLLDPDSPDWVVDRNDVFVLGASTVYLGSVI